MNIMQPSVTVLNFDPIRMFKTIERAARLCYKSEGNMGDTPNLPFIRKKIDAGHMSVTEHEKISVIVVCDRGVSHEIVRHRLAAYSQESTRYCNYFQEKHGRQINVIEPFFFLPETGKDAEESRQLMHRYNKWMHSCIIAEADYMDLIDAGAIPQEARSVLPNSLKTEIMITYNMREWRHFFSLRAEKPAHPQMKQIAIPLLKWFQTVMPMFFGDIDYDRDFEEKYEKYFAKIVYENE